MELAELRSNIDMEKLYVDFALLRTALTVVPVAEDLGVSLSEASREGERRATCPKCEKERAFSLNINTNRFNCFAKGCNLKGGGVIDFFAKLYEVSAKEASHLLAYAYGIQPYTQQEDPVVAELTPVTVPITAPAESNGEAAALPIKREVEPSPQISQDACRSAQHLIASIERQIAELKQLLVSQ